MNTYLNSNTQRYENCYKTCETCSQNGDGQNNNCDSCAKSYTPQVNNKKNCEVKCDSFFYYDNFNIRFCTSEEQCPADYPLLTPSTGRCVDKCNTNSQYSNDPYINRYNGECIDSCKEGLVLKTQRKICLENKINVG